MPNNFVVPWIHVRQARQRCAHAWRKDSPLDSRTIASAQADLMGNGIKCRVDPKAEPKVMFDGVTPTR
jgi:hypothetical protein